MTIKELREELGMSLADFAAAIGLSSKGYASELERGNVSCSVATALAIEKLSSGRIPAASLNDDVALVEAARAS